MAKSFHQSTGSLITLINSHRTAYRNHPLQEFNNGVIMSNEPLEDNELFEVRIDKKLANWSGSIEIGITSLNPSNLSFPSSAANLRDGSWVMSGTSILKDGRTHCEDYGQDLDELMEGDRVGIMRTSSGELHFFINGIDQGVAATGITGAVYAVIDLYGKCAQVSIVDQTSKRPESLKVEERLHFHENCGTMVKLTNGKLTAERKRPYDEFNNGVVMTHRPLKENELFEIRIDELVNKWSGSIEMGITTHNPDNLAFPATMTNMRSGTIMMSGCGILTNGKGSRREYGEYNLDELHEGDRIGLIKKSNKNLHYYINGLDQGIAAENVPAVVYGVVDLYGMTVKVSITDYLMPTLSDIDSQTNSSSLDIPNRVQRRVVDDDLFFHPNCGQHVSVINRGLTAIRPNCLDDFNNAVVITNRPLYPGELFEVLLEQVVVKWAGSIEIGVTTHSAEELDFPSTMTNIRSGTWMMTENGIMYNGTIIADEYGKNLEKLKAGDKVGVVVYDDKKLHFFINGIDQGLAARNIPEGVYGVIDLYGQAAKASIVHGSGTPTLYDVNQSSLPEIENESCLSQASSLLMDTKNTNVAKIENDHINEISRPRLTYYDHHSIYFDDEEDDDLDFEGYSNDVIIEPPHSFHLVHGTAIHFDPLHLTATRRGDYNNGLVFGAKPLENNDIFEIYIFTTNRQWGGSLAFGVTTYNPGEHMVLPSDAMKLIGNCDTWLMFESQIYKNGQVVKRNYTPYFPWIVAGDKIGVKIFNDDSLHFFINEVDLGIAATNMPKQNLRVVADVYGKVEAIQIYQDYNALYGISDIKKADKSAIEKASVNEINPIVYSEPPYIYFHENHGRNIQLSNNNLTASRIASYNQGVVMSCKALQCDELFQIRIDNLQQDWSGSIQIGVTNQKPDIVCLPITALSLRRGTYVICGDSIFYNGTKIRAKYGPNLDNLKNRHLVGVKIDQNMNLHLYVDGVDQGIAVEDIQLPAYAIVDVYGRCLQVTITTEEYSSDEETEKDDKEKADIENKSLKEKKLKNAVNAQRIQTKCKHQNICEKIKTLIGLPDAYFLVDNVVCFCENCHKSRGDEQYFRKGDPPKDYAEPFGWCRFPLKTLIKAEKASIDEKWHVAYHGTRFGFLRQILEKGELLPPDLLGFKVRNRTNRKNEASKDSESCHVLISPTMRYAGSPKFSPKEDFYESSNRKMYHVRVAFQVFVRPGSYIIGPQQLGVRDPIDVHFSNNDLEWYTKEEGAIVLHSLLMKIEGL